MTTEQIIASWKDVDYRMSLSQADLALLPENPAGLMELTDEEMLEVAGGTTTPACAWAFVAAVESNAPCAALVVAAVSYAFCGS